MRTHQFHCIHVRKNVPMPERAPRKQKGAFKAFYPWHRMDIGDSFAFPEWATRNAYAAAASASLHTGMKFQVFKIGNSYHCWRVE